MPVRFISDGEAAGPPADRVHHRCWAAGHLRGGPLTFPGQRGGATVPSFHAGLHSWAPQLEDMGGLTDKQALLIIIRIHSCREWTWPRWHPEPKSFSRTPCCRTFKGLLNPPVQTRIVLCSPFRGSGMGPMVRSRQAVELCPHGWDIPAPKNWPVPTHLTTPRPADSQPAQKL